MYVFRGDQYLTLKLIAISRLEIQLWYNLHRQKTIIIIIGLSRKNK